jgi:DNA invertase Pin-like site-specific DNA recombinase
MVNRPKAVGYLRVSTTEQELSPIAQKDLIEQWAKLNYIELVSVHLDQGVSGSMPWMERPGLSAAVQDVKRHGASWLVVAKMDRLSRDLFGQLHLGKHLETMGARYVSCTEAPEAQTPEKTLMQNVIGAFAEFERAQIRSRIKAALAVRKAQGVRLGPAPMEATEYGRCLIWYIWHLNDRGMGAHRITTVMNEQGLRGVKGGQMHQRNIERILKRERPTEVPKLWRGPDTTWHNFRRNGEIARNRTDPNAPRGQKAKRRVEKTIKYLSDAEQRRAGEVGE